MRIYKASKIEKSKAKRRTFHASRPKRLQPAWGPDSINTQAVFSQLLRSGDLTAAKDYRDQCKTYGTADPLWDIALMQRAA